MDQDELYVARMIGAADGFDVDGLIAFAATGDQTSKQELARLERRVKAAIKAVRALDARQPA